MPAEWLKYNSDLPEKPEVGYIARACDLDVFSVAGRLMAVWHWFSRQTEDGAVALMSRSDARDAGASAREQMSLQSTRAPQVEVEAVLSQIDRVAGCEGFAQAMLDARWLQIDPDAIRCKSWEKHNIGSKKRREKNTDRQRKRRVDADPERDKKRDESATRARHGRDGQREIQRDTGATLSRERDSLSLSERERESLEKGERADAAAPPARGRAGGAAGTRKPRKGRGGDTSPPAPDPQSMREPRCIAEARRIIRENGDTEADAITPIEAVMRMCASLRSDGAAMDHLRTACDALGKASDEIEDLFAELARRRDERRAGAA